MDVAVWLQELGLGHYEAMFRDNGVEPGVLVHLTADDLREMGISAVGHRRKLMQAIAMLRDESLRASQGLAAGERTAEPADEPAAERRQLTVLFADLVGSTALAHRLDPEDLQSVMRDYQVAASAEIRRFDGYIAKFLGDGVLAYFGWPRAHEDAAERAVRAGLALVERIALLVSSDTERLAARVGIATGLVVVGEPPGDERPGDPAFEAVVVGETPNLAARLQALAMPGHVVIADSTRRLVGSLFELEELGTPQLKGFPAPVPVFAVASANRVEGRFEALHGAAVMPLIGRDQELALLLDRWAQAKEGDGQVVLLSGEPGIGKSRLVRALREQLIGQRHLELGHFCSPFQQTSALHPVIDHLERAAAFGRQDDAATKLAKLEALLARGTKDLARAVPPLAALLDIPTGPAYPAAILSPHALKDRVFAVLLDQLAGLAATTPLLAVYEDLHWADPTTLELLERAIDRVQRLPVLVVATFRPGGGPPWAQRAHVTSLTLSRLSRRRGAALVAEVTGGKILPAEIVERIVEKTDGVPLFVEELTKTLLESPLLRAYGDRYELTEALPSLAVPTTLHDSLLARLERSPPVKAVAQIGAAIGRTFERGLLAAVAGLPDEVLDEALRQLVETELVFRREDPPDAVYVFKHALVRDAAYESLLKSRRRQLHWRIVEVLETHFAEIVALQPDLLAHHAAEAGLFAKSVAYWYKAGQRAVARSAIAEAIARLTRGLELLPLVAEEDERQRLELDLQVALGPALIAAKGFAAPETGNAYARACALGEAQDDVAKLCPALYGRAVFHFQRGELMPTYDFAQALLRLARERGVDTAVVTGHRMIGSSLSQLGRLAESREHLDAALNLYDPVRDRSSCFVYAIDSRLMCLAWLAHVLAMQGHPELALARRHEAEAWASTLGHASTTAVDFCWGCIFRQLSHDAASAAVEAEAVMSFSAEQGFPLWHAAGRVIRGWALVINESVALGRAEIAAGIADYRATGAEMWSPYFLGLQAEAEGRAADAGQGLATLSEARLLLERTGARWIEAELDRVEGALLLALPEPRATEAATLFERALATARTQGARLWELRAATALARLWRDQGNATAAHELLSLVCGGFEVGTTSPDLEDARSMLRSSH